MIQILTSDGDLVCDDECHSLRNILASLGNLTQRTGPYGNLEPKLALVEGQLCKVTPDTEIHTRHESQGSQAEAYHYQIFMPKWRWHVQGENGCPHRVDFMVEEILPETLCPTNHVRLTNGRGTTSLLPESHMESAVDVDGRNINFAVGCEGEIFLSQSKVSLLSPILYRPLREKFWFHPTGIPVGQPFEPAPYAGRFSIVSLVAHGANSHLYAIDTASGQLNRFKRFPSGWDSQPVVYDLAQYGIDDIRQGRIFRGRTEDEDLLLMHDRYHALRFYPLTSQGIQPPVILAGTWSQPLMHWLWMRVWPLALILVSVFLTAASMATLLMQYHRHDSMEIASYHVVAASVLRRVAAKLVDLLVFLFPPALWLAWHFGQVDHLSQLHTPGVIGTAALHLSPGSVLVFGLITLAPLLLVAVCEWRWGVTPGKWLAGIEVIRTTGRRCGIVRGVLRSLALPVDIAFFGVVGLRKVAFSPSWQRWGDLMADTLVIRTARPTEKAIN